MINSSFSGNHSSSSSFLSVTRGPKEAPAISSASSLSVSAAVKTRSLGEPKSTGRQVHPGYSMIDWNRFCSASRDLAGTGGRLLRVTEEELGRHASEDDLWTSLRGTCD